MSDQSNIPKGGKGKAVATFPVTFAAVYGCFIIKTHYRAFFDALEASGIPDDVMLAGMIAVLSTVATWWASANLVGDIIGFILNVKRVIKVARDPLPPQ